MKIVVPDFFTVEIPVDPDTTTLSYFDPKQEACIGYVFDDAGHVHFALQLGEAVIAFEHIPENYPATDVAIYRNRAQWIKSISQCDWIVDGLREDDPVRFHSYPPELLESREGANEEELTNLKPFTHEEMTKMKKKQMTTKEVEFLQDIEAFLRAAISGGMDFPDVLCTLGHDINGVISRGFSLESYDSFHPRVTGYRTKEKNEQ